MSYQVGTGSPGALKRRSQVAVIVLAAVSLIAVLLTLSATTGTAEAQLSALPTATTCFAFDESDDGSNALTHDSYLHTVTSAAATVSPTLSINGNVENIAVRNDTGEVYAYDAGGNGATDQLYAVDPATGAFSSPADYGLAGLGDVDAMFFVSDEDGDVTNDVLWVLVDPNVLTGYDVNGAVVGGPVTISVPAGETIEGATWLAEPAPGEFFIHYTTTGSATTSIMASLGTGTTPGSSPSNIGGTEVDVEGFGTDGAGSLYLTTGGDATNSLYSVTTGAATNLIVDLASVGGYADFESVDCAAPGITLTKTVTAGPTANGDGTFAYEFSFLIENTGHLPLSNIVLTDAYVFTPAGVTATNLVSTNDCPVTLLINASCTYTDTVDLSAAAGTYNNEATVDATGSFGQPVTSVSDVDFPVPAIDDPSLDIVKTVVNSVADCPTSFAGGDPSFDTLQASIGDTVIYCINVINNGPGDAINVQVADSLTAVTTSIGALAANDQDSYNYARVITADDEVNTATVSGQNITGAAVATASDDAGTVPLPVIDPSLSIVKTVVRSAADCPGTLAGGDPTLDTIQADIGETVFYCINVRNDGPGDAFNVEINDDLAGTTFVIGNLAANAESAETYSHVVGAAPETNVAVVTGEKSDGSAADSAEDDAGTVARPPLPSVEIIKTVVLPSQACPADFAAAVATQGPPTDTITADVGEFVKYCINVINNGPGPAFNVEVSDPQDDNSPRDRGNLAAGAETSFLYLRDVLASPSTNVATVTADDSEGNQDVSTDTDDAGVTPPDLGALGSYVWEDVNEDGIQDAGEGVAGVTVTAVGPSGTVTDITDANGEYLIDGLLPGTYTVTFSTPAGRTWTLQNVGADDAVDSDADATGNAGTHVVAAGATNDTVDAGILPLPPELGALGSYVWEDVNEDGIQDAGEGVAGVTVTAVGPSGTVTDITDANGEYLIDGLLPGTYTVTFSTPAGRTWTLQNVGADDAVDSDADATGNAGTHVVTANQTNPTVDAGLVPVPPELGALGTYVWEDVNEDGIQDVGEGVAGVTVTAIGPSGTLTDITDANGEYLIDGLLPGTYTVIFTTPAGRTWTLQDVGADDAVDSDADATGNAGTHVVTANQTNPTVDAGLIPVPPELGALGTYVWEDVNEDGIQDAGEGVAGVTVTAVGPSGTVTDITDANGEYLIDGLLPGTYTVTFTTPAGRTWTLQDVGADDAVDSDADATGNAGTHVVTAGQTNPTVDAGLIPVPPELGALGTYVWEDVNEDGIQDAGEGVAGVTVTAIGPSGTLTDITDANGEYLIDGLLPGTYTVLFTTPAGRTWTLQDVGADDAVDSDADATGNAGTHVVTANQTNPTVDAGLIPVPPELGALGTYVWEDVNEDGIQDAGEGVAGVTVTAVGPSGTVSDITDANGEYLIDGLLPGTYTVTFTTPAGRSWTLQNVGADDAVDSDADAAGNAGTHVVTAGQTNPTVDAGLVPVPPELGAIGTYVWEDVNEDGIQDVGEGVAGVTVTAIGPSGTVTDVTDADGEYLIDGLLPGTYTVIFTTPAGRSWTLQNVGADDTVDSDAAASGNAGTHVVTANQTNPTVDAGLVPVPPELGAIGSYVWEDVNSDGIQDAGEGIAGVTVTAVGPSGTVSDITDANGEYLIDGLLAGTYTVTFTTPAGRTWTTQNAGADDAVDSDADATGNAGTHVVTAGQTNPTVDAGVLPEPGPQPGAIGSYVWEDINSDGIQDAGEGVAGVTVTAIGPSGTLTDVTDANGEYLIDGLAPGTYTVLFTTPTGRSWTAQNVGADDAADSDADSAGNAGTHVVVSDQTNPTVDAGLLPLPAQLGNFVWIDSNSNGQQDTGEPGVAGVTINIWSADANGDPVSIVREVMTDGNGFYSSGDLAPGDYIVQVVTPAGHEVTSLGASATSDTDNNIAASGLSAVVTLAPGETNNTIDAGYVVIPPDDAELGNFVWVDQNGNGIQDAGEPGVSNVEVNIWSVDANGDPAMVVKTVTTDANGLYSSGGLAPGTYIVQINTPAGHAVTVQGTDPASDTDSNLGANNLTAAVTLVAGENNPTIDAGFVPLGSIGDFIFNDANNNGVQDAGEAPVAGATITAFSVAADGTRTQVGFDTSDANGKYLIDNLAAGDYVVSISLPSGFELTTADAGADTADSDFSPATGEVSVTLGLNDINITIDAGVVGEPDPVDPPTRIVVRPEYPGPFKVVPNMVMNPFAPIAATPGSGGTGGGLAHTGSETPALAAIAIGLLCVGSVMFVGARRERYDEE